VSGALEAGTGDKAGSGGTAGDEAFGAADASLCGDSGAEEVTP